MPSKASALVAQAKQWATYYGDYSNGEEGAVLTVPLRIRAAWERNDADAFAEIFVDNGSMLVGDEQLRGRDEIRKYMAAAFEGPYKGGRLTEEPLEIKLLAPDVAVAITQGGVLYEGDTEVPPGRQVRTMWVVTKKDGDWRLVSHQSSPLKG
jgi:uncharacterized protein (TIGR02246 family)